MLINIFLVSIMKKFQRFFGRSSVLNPLDESGSSKVTPRPNFAHNEDRPNVVLSPKVRERLELKQQLRLPHLLIIE